jgi:hypothetical protein
MTKLFTLITAILLIAIPIQANAAKKSKVDQDKDRLVLMPLRLTEDIQNMQGAMETSLAEGLHEKYIVFSGAEVKAKASTVFKKATANQKCDETRCLQDIAMAFQAELVAVASVTKIDGGYLLALSIRNVYDNKSVYDKSIPCKGCDPFEVVDRLKVLGGANQLVAYSTVTSVSPSTSERPNRSGYVSQGGLTWMPVNESKKTWREANNYCVTTYFNGQSGWRLPTLAELNALYKSGEMYNHGWILDDTWSSDAVLMSTAHFNVRLSNGHYNGGADSLEFLVTCVHPN